MKIKIKRKVQKSANTQYGQKTTYSLLCEGQKGDQWVSVWSNSVTDVWREGDTVDMIIKTTQGKNGHVFYNGEPTEKPGQPNAAATVDLTEIENRLGQLMSEVLAIRKILESDSRTPNDTGELPPPPTDADAPPEEEVEVLPF